MNRMYRELLLPIPAGEMIYVLGHKNPDSDAVGAAIGYAMLLERFGVRAIPAVPGPVNAETRFALKTLGLEEPVILESAADLSVVLVDHSSRSQSVPDLNRARILGVIDHHGIGDVATGEPIFVRCAGIGAASTLVWLCWMECGQELSPEAASALLMGILSDTRNLTRNVTRADRLAVEALSGILEMHVAQYAQLYADMRRALVDYSGMSDADIFDSDYREYEMAGVRFGIGVARAPGNWACRELEKHLTFYMEENFDAFGVDMLFLMVSNTEPDKTALILSGIGRGAKEILALAFGPETDGRIELGENLSRKSQIVPKLSSALEKWVRDGKTTS